MKNTIEILVFSEGHTECMRIRAWLSKTVMPVIVKLEHRTKKLVLKSLPDAPAIYMS